METSEDGPRSAPTRATASRESAEGWRWPVAVGLLHAVVFAPLVLGALFRPGVLFPNLWLWHAARIPETFRTPTEPIQPHFGWPGLSRLVDLLLPGSDPRVAGAAVSLFAAAAFGVVLYLLFRRCDDGQLLMPRVAAAGASVVVALIESPAALQGWKAVADPDRSFVPMYYPFVPTTFASMALNVAAVWMTAQLVLQRSTPRQRTWLPWVVVAACIAKPNLMPSLAVVAFGVALVMAQRRTADRPDRLRVVPEVAWRVVLPALVVTGLQFTVLAELSPPELSGGLAIRPFYELEALGGFGWQFWLILLFPLGALLVAPRRMLGDMSVLLCGGCFLVGLAATVVFARTGETPYQGGVGGDVLQMASVAATTMVVFLARRAVELRRNGSLGTAAAVTLVVLLVPYVAAGAATYRCHSGLVECYPASDAPTWPQPSIDEPIRFPGAEGP